MTSPQIEWPTTGKVIRSIGIVYAAIIGMSGVS